MGEIICTPITDEVEQSMLDYGMSIITDRALPSAEDGLKPVNRRLLYDMFDKGYMNNKKFVKCAQPVGDTMGRFHPHGDSSIYGALVWMSQPWNMRYPLIAWHGNNGSRDGDEPAAYRYTECKLSKIGEEMLADIKKNTVDWQNAYTDEEEEPIYLPGRIPNLIVNGTSGIAWAMACSFAPHNLTEVMDATIHILENPECPVKDVLNYITGPDFPTGGLVVNKDELPSAYLTGKGRARIRGEYVVESDKKGDTIVFTSIPYKVSKEVLVIKIDELCNEGKLNGIAAIRDESNKDGVRFVIELEKGVSAEPIVSKLFKLTPLENTYSFNQVALIDKKPVLVNMKQLIESYIEHQRDVLLRKTKFDLDKIKARIHILDGLLIALEDIDNVIALIKKSESAAVAKTNLMAKYNLSEVQAKAILDMKLSRLARLEKIEIENEKNEKVLESKRLEGILANPTPELKRIFEEVKNEYGDARRTTITQAAVTKEEKEIEFVEPEKCVVIMTEGGLIKRVPATSFRTQKRGGKGVKTQDDITQAVIRTNTIDSLMIFTNKGKMYRLLVDEIPAGTNATKGQSIKSLVAMDRDEEASIIYSIYRDTDAKYVLFVTKNGMVKKTTLEEYVKTKKKTGIAAISIKEGDELVSVSLVKDEPLVLVTGKGMAIKFSSMDVSATSRATSGVKGMNLNDGDYIVAALPVRHDTDSLAVFSEAGLGKKFELSELITQKRGGKGLICYKPTDKTGDLTCAALIADEDNILVCGLSNSICISATEVPALGRISVGNQILKGTKLLSVTKV
ncbi:MAG: DNA topoisomerase 4 subunit A [Bacteroidales bacterium]|nr:DNA topoisomerase 4 subunit A [Bacteroidales bacterium]